MEALGQPVVPTIPNPAMQSQQQTQPTATQPNVNVPQEPQMPDMQWKKPVNDAMKTAGKRVPVQFMNALVDLGGAPGYKIGNKSYPATASGAQNAAAAITAGQI